MRGMRFSAITAHEWERSSQKDKDWIRNVRARGLFEGVEYMRGESGEGLVDTSLSQGKFHSQRSLYLGEKLATLSLASFCGNFT